MNPFRATLSLVVIVSALAAAVSFLCGAIPLGYAYIVLSTVALVMNDYTERAAFTGGSRLSDLQLAV